MALRGLASSIVLHLDSYLQSCISQRAGLVDVDHF